MGFNNCHLSHKSLKDRAFSGIIGSFGSLVAPSASSDEMKIKKKLSSSGVILYLLASITLEHFQISGIIGSFDSLVASSASSTVSLNCKLFSLSKLH